MKICPARWRAHTLRSSKLVCLRMDGRRSGPFGVGPSSIFEKLTRRALGVFGWAPHMVFERAQGALENLEATREAEFVWKLRFC
jgi:hypothetical protein